MTGVRLDDAVCRVCLSSSGNIKIFDGCGKDDQFRFCTSLEASEDDGLPSKLCKKCNDHLKVAYDFRFQAIYAEKYFRKTIFLPSLKKELNASQSGVEGNEGQTSIELDENMQEIDKLLSINTHTVTCTDEAEDDSAANNLNNDSSEYYGHHDDYDDDISRDCRLSKDSDKAQQCSLTTIANIPLIMNFETEKKVKIEETNSASVKQKQFLSKISVPTCNTQIHSYTPLDATSLSYTATSPFSNQSVHDLRTEQDNSESQSLPMQEVTSKNVSQYNVNVDGVINYPGYYTQHQQHNINSNLSSTYATGVHLHTGPPHMQVPHTLYQNIIPADVSSPVTAYNDYSQTQYLPVPSSVSNFNQQATYSQQSTIVSVSASETLNTSANGYNLLPVTLHSAHINDIVNGATVSVDSVVSEPVTYNSGTPPLSTIAKTTKEQNEDILNMAKVKSKREPDLKTSKEKIECNICGTIFTHINSLKTHLLKHSGEKPYKCEYCQKAFARKTVLNIHRRLHTGEKPYKCNDCIMAYVTKEALTRHKQKDHEEGKNFRKDKVTYICSICNKSRCSKYSLAAHMRTHASQARERRRISKKKRDTSAVVTAAKMQTFSSPNNGRPAATLKYCKICQQGFPNKWELSAHAESHNLNKTFECDLCKRTFEKKFQLLYHLQTHDGAEELIKKKLQPELKREANVEIKEEEKNANQQAQKQKLNDRVCVEECNESDDDKPIVQRRRRGRPKGYKVKKKRKRPVSEFDTESNDSEDVNCDDGENVEYCEKPTEKAAHKKKSATDASQFSKARSKRENLKSLRSAGNVIKCHICDAFFTHPTSLKTHMLIHSGERPFKCEDCGKAFARKTVLNIHRRLHTGEKPYQCPLCSMASVTKEALMRHMSKDHDDEREADRIRFTCGICHKAMGTKYSLQAHMKLHEQQQKEGGPNEESVPIQFSCKTCGETFDSKEDYSKHMHVHDRHQNFQCDICQMTFEKKFKLLFHLQTHKLEDMPCKKCGETFSIREELIQHTKLHFDKKNLDFQCPECDVGLYDTRDLKLHMSNIHDVAMGNLNACDMCGESYGTAGEYYKHMYDKHDVINKTCNECEKYFDSRKAFDKHILTHYMS